MQWGVAAWERVKRQAPVTKPMPDDLNAAYDECIWRGSWVVTSSNDYGTSVVPIQKALLPGQKKAKSQLFGDHSVTINPQLKMHWHPIQWPEDLMQKVGGHYLTNLQKLTL